MLPKYNNSFRKYFKDSCWSSRFLAEIFLKLALDFFQKISKGFLQGVFENPFLEFHHKFLWHQYLECFSQFFQDFFLDFFQYVLPNISFRISLRFFKFFLGIRPRVLPGTSLEILPKIPSRIHTGITI